MSYTLREYKTAKDVYYTKKWKNRRPETRTTAGNFDTGI